MKRKKKIPKIIKGKHPLPQVLSGAGGIASEEKMGKL